MHMREVIVECRYHTALQMIFTNHFSGFLPTSVRSVQVHKVLLNWAERVQMGWGVDGDGVMGGIEKFREANTEERWPEVPGSSVLVEKDRKWKRLSVSFPGLYRECLGSSKQNVVLQRNVDGNSALLPLKTN
jgi:hypothetical protein